MLARDLGYTVAKLESCLSAREFAEWQVIYAKERLHPVARRFAQAQQLAAQLQGPSTRRDRKPWTAADFAEPDPWAAKPQRAARPSGSMAQQMRALTKRK